MNVQESGEHILIERSALCIWALHVHVCTGHAAIVVILQKSALQSSVELLSRKQVCLYRMYHPPHLPSKPIKAIQREAHDDGVMSFI